MIPPLSPPPFWSNHAFCPLPKKPSPSTPAENFSSWSAAFSKATGTPPFSTTNLAHASSTKTSASASPPPPSLPTENASPSAALTTKANPTTIALRYPITTRDRKVRPPGCAGESNDGARQDILAGHQEMDPDPSWQAGDNENEKIAAKKHPGSAVRISTLSSNLDYPPVRPGPKAASKPSRQKQISAVNKR